MKLRSFFRAFFYAGRGFVCAVRTERNLRFHLCAAAYALWLGALARLDTARWAAVLLCCGAVMGFELMNTAVEAVCNRLCPQRDPLIRLAKDAAAGAVLIMAVFAAGVGLIIYLPWLTGGGWQGMSVPMRAALLFGILPCVWFIACGGGNKPSK